MTIITCVPTQSDRRCPAEVSSRTMLSTTYITPLASLLKHHSMAYHLYADDTQPFQERKCCQLKCAATSRSHGVRGYPHHDFRLYIRRHDFRQRYDFQWRHSRIDTDFDEAVANISLTAIVKYWLSVLLENRDINNFSEVIECIIPQS